MIIEPIPESDKYRLCKSESLTYNGKKYAMSEGMLSNGGNIPRFFWSLSTTPYDPRAIRGFFWHDYFYETQVISKRLADKIFKHILLKDGIEKQIAENIYQTVRDFGGPAWKRCKKKLKDKKDES